MGYKPRKIQNTDTHEEFRSGDLIGRREEKEKEKRKEKRKRREKRKALSIERWISKWKGQVVGGGCTEFLSQV